MKPLLCMPSDDTWLLVWVLLPYRTLSAPISHSSSLLEQVIVALWWSTTYHAANCVIPLNLLWHCASGGERQVFRLLENRKREELTEQLLNGQDKAQAQNRSRVRSFFCDPNALGENLYTIIKFGLVQYVSSSIICSLSQHWQITACHKLLWQNCRWFWRHYVLSWHWFWSLLEPMEMVNSSGTTGNSVVWFYVLLESAIHLALGN